jgi:hypothetical protein
MWLNDEGGNAPKQWQHIYLYPSQEFRNSFWFSDETMKPPKWKKNENEKKCEKNKAKWNEMKLNETMKPPHLPHRTPWRQESELQWKDPRVKRRRRTLAALLSAENDRTGNLQHHVVWSDAEKVHWIIRQGKDGRCWLNLFLTAKAPHQQKAATRPAIAGSNEKDL